jgi:hypothetical protein
LIWSLLNNLSIPELLQKRLSGEDGNAMLSGSSVPSLLTTANFRILSSSFSARMPTVIHSPE